MNKLKKTLLIRLAALVFSILLLSLCLRVLITSWQTSQAINEEILAQQNPTLQKALILQAVETVQSFADLTTSSPSATLEKEVSQEESTPSAEFLPAEGR